ncbi:MAG: serine/threonine protein kinase [Prevotellaceae bacterium]|nr:serine/threonine protein kinase [Prevotellaceae bacterium]
MHLQNGTLLQGGRYRIDRFISSGGFGCTYEAEHVMLQKRVAIKELFVRDFCNRDERTAHVTVGTESKRGLVDKLRGKFLDEARAICKLQHKGIVGVTDVFEENGTAYFVMDYIEGQSLAEMVGAHGPLPEARALRYIRQVADALAYVHEHNRLHLDIKPGNIMVNSHDEAVLIDFGTSKQYDEVDGENTSTLMGKTPGYAPPEQMGNDVVKFTPATDIYSLGATLYKVLTGITPLSATLLVSGEELAPLPTGTSKGVSDAIDAAMQVNKKKRPQSIADFLAILDGGGDAVETTVMDVPPEPKPQPKPKPKPKPQSEPKPKPVSPPAGQSDGPEPKSSVWVVAVGIVVIGLIVAFAVVRCNKPSSASGDVEAVEEVGDTVPYDTAVNVERLVKYNGVTFTYTGPVNHSDMPDGEGTGVYKDGTYKGMYVNGCREGKATYVTSGGEDRFVGTFHDDKYSEGTLTIEDGSYFQGTYKDNEPYTGTWYNSDGSVYCKLRNGNMQ